MGRSILHPSHISRSAAAMKAQSKSKRPRVQGGYFEALESRTLLTAVFTPVFGVETTSSGPDEHMTQPPIYLILWGSYWGGTNTPQAQAIIDAANKVITSPFPHIVDQYGADGSNMVIAQTVWDSSDPSSGNFDSGNIDDVVQNQIDNGPFPEAQDATNNPIYVVVTPPKVMSNDPKAAGFNIVQSDFDLPLDFDDVPEAWSWTGRNGDGSLNVDAFSLTFSHEVAEIMSDYDQEGYQINAGANWFGGGDNQIGDKEGNFYSFRMSNGVDVQPVWSRADNAWAVNDGTTQKFNFLPNWSGQNFNFNYALTLNGDQLGPNDDVTVGSTPAGGVTVTLNGEVMNFDKNYLSGITIDTGIGLNTVHVNPLPANVTLSITSTGGFVTLDGPNTANAWNITGANAGTLNGYSFNRVTDLVGASASDTFTFQPGGTLGGTADGGGGTNSITGPDTDNFWSLTGADSGGLDLHASFKNVQNIQGGNSGDIFDFEGSGFISGNINGAGFGPDRNTLSFANFLSPVSVNLQSKTASRIGGTFSIINQVIGSVLPDTLTGPASATWTIDSANGGSVGGTQFTSFENLVGNSFTDSFVFMPGGSITGNLDGGLGTNTLDYHNLAGPITVNLGTGTGPGIGGTFSNIT
ncbi:MAG: hypothetical protein JWM97_25, partial [Phycisphaerales bacterium]|nr:hypothetical protein [Phycisphaerales bacterium]